MKQTSGTQQMTGKVTGKASALMPIAPHLNTLFTQDSGSWLNNI
jgi:hypothetical protein